MTLLASGVFKYSGQPEKQKDSGTRTQPLLYLRDMTYAATYNCIRHLPDVRYDVMSRVTTVGNALPAVAFPSHDRHTAVFTEPYPGPEGLDTRYTSVSGTKRSWLCYHRDICNESYKHFQTAHIYLKSRKL